jgi:hypothetical protein
VHDGQSLVYKNVMFAPGLFKIFDEILVNAADNKVRDPTMDMLKVDILPVGGVLFTRGTMDRRCWWVWCGWCWDGDGWLSRVW